MREKLRTITAALGGLLLTAGFAAADAPVALEAQPALAKDLPAFPRLTATPGNDGAARINQALAKADARARDTVKQCREDAGKRAGWSRSLTVTMRGAGYLGFYVADYWDCGGAHPNTGQMALIYDLATGSPLNWMHVLPPALAKSANIVTADDGTPIGQVLSPGLTALYLKSSNSKSVDPGCPDALKDTDLGFILWPDAEKDGIGLQPAPGDLPFAVAACGQSVVIPTSQARTLGVAPALLDAIDEAHKNGWYDKAKP